MPAKRLPYKRKIANFVARDPRRTGKPYFLKMKSFKALLFVVVIMAAFSCNSKAKQTKEANLRLERVAALIKTHQLNSAKSAIDSIHKLYPYMVEVRRSAFNYTDTINKMESEQTLNYCAGQLTRKRMLMDSLQRYFILERNEKYEDVGSYVFRSQKTEPNASRTYLKITVDENGSIFLTSNYTGAKLSYRHLKVSAADLSIVTDTLNNTDIYVNAYSNGGQWHESVTWQGKALNGVPEFIVQNAAKPIDITLIGKRNYRYRLSESDKKAMVTSYELWKAISDVTRLKKEIQKADVKIKRIKHFKN